MKIRLVALALLPCFFTPGAFASNAKVISDTTLSFLDGGKVDVKKGTTVYVSGRRGDNLVVQLRSATGYIPKEFVAYSGHWLEVESPPPQIARPTPASPKPSVEAPRAKLKKDSESKRQPTTSYGKAIDKAKDVIEKQKLPRREAAGGLMDEK